MRPALPAVTTEPRVGPEDLQGVVEGNVVVEITIDESGRIVNKAVVQSMGPALGRKGAGRAGKLEFPSRHSRRRTNSFQARCCLSLQAAFRLSLTR